MSVAVIVRYGGFANEFSLATQEDHPQAIEGQDTQTQGQHGGTEGRHTGRPEAQEAHH